MTTMETLDLQSRVARYETAVDELRAAHQDIRTVLQDQVLYARWQQIGAELGFMAAQAHPEAQQIPQMAESWAG